MPANFASGLSSSIQFTMASDTTNTVVMGFELMAVTGGDAAVIETDSFAVTNSSAAITVSTTAGALTTFNISMANADGVAANDLVILRTTRITGDANDTAVGDFEMTSLWADYITV